MRDSKTIKYGIIYTIILVQILIPLVLLIYDLSTEPYWSCIPECIYKNDMGDFIGFILAIWAVIISFILFFLERKDERFFGVRIIYLLELNNMAMIFQLTVIFIEIIFLAIAIIASFPLTVLGVFGAQVIRMAILILIICCYYKDEFLIKRIKRQVVKIVDAMNDNDNDNGNKAFENFLKMEDKEAQILAYIIKNVDYTNYEDKRKLLDILYCSISEECNQKYQVGERIEKIQFRIVYLHYRIASWIIDAATLKQYDNVLMAWLNGKR